MNRNYYTPSGLLKPLFVLILMGIAFGVSVEASAQKTDADRSGQALIFPTNRPIKGRVIDKNGIPIVGAVVSHFGDSAEMHNDHSAAPFKFANSTTTDLFGRCTLKDLNPRRCRVCIFHPDFQIRWASPVSLYSDVVLHKTRSVSGSIFDHLGKPIEGARFRPALVDVEDIGFEPPEYQSGADGRVNLKGIVEGENGSYFVVETESKAGPFKARFIWYPGKARQVWEGARSPGTLEVEGDDFKVTLPKPDPVTLELVEQESGRPAMVESAEFWTLHSTATLRQWSQKGLTTKGNMVEFGFLRPGLNYISIHMKPELMLPDRLVLIERAANAKPLDRQRVDVVRGAKITGRVVEKVTGQPIADAAVAYIPNDPAVHLRNGIVTPKFVRSDKDGNFELVVPAAEARLRIAGECGPFCTPPVEQSVSSGGSAIERSKLIKNFELSFNPEPGETVDLPAFELERSQVIRGKVVDPQGLPVSNAEYLVAPKHYQSNRSPIYGSTDDQGRFELDNVLTNALTDLPFSAKQGAVLFWDRERTLVGRAEFSEQTDTQLEVVLKPAHAVLGRVVDGISGDPIAGAMATLSTGGKLEIAAKSAKDGTFLLEFFSQKNSSFSVSYPGYQNYRGHVEIDPKRLLKEIDDIAITAYNAYGLPERAPDVKDKSLNEALSVLNGYLETELNRIPETSVAYDWNSAEPQFIFKTRVASELNDTVEKMLERFPNPVDRTRLALLVFDRLSQDRAGKMVPFSDTTRLLYAEVILKNMDNPVVMEATKKYELQWSSFTHPGIVLNNNQTAAAKLWAVRKLLADHSLMSGLNGPTHLSDELFESTLQDMKQAWMMGLNEFSEETYADYPPGVEISESQYLGNIVRNQMNQAQRRISETTHDKERGARVQALIDSLTQESP